MTGRMELAGRIGLEYVRVLVLLRRTTLGEAVSRPVPAPGGREDPRRLSRAVTRVLGRLRGDRARCIHRALVLQRLLARQGDPAVLVVGMPEVPTDVRAHAWVELAGRDIGPAPGRGQHVELARYGDAS